MVFVVVTGQYLGNFVAYIDAYVYVSL